MKILSTKQLADLLGTTPRTINTMRWQIKKGIIDPCRLPRALNLPGARPAYTDEDVQCWMDEVRGVATRPASKVAVERRTSQGRPRKTDIPSIKLL